MGPRKEGQIIKSGTDVDLLQRNLDLLRRSNTSLALSDLDHVVNGTMKGGISYKKGTTCGSFTEKNRPTQEVQHLLSSF